MPAMPRKCDPAPGDAPAITEPTRAAARVEMATHVAKDTPKLARPPDGAPMLFKPALEQAAPTKLAQNSKADSRAKRFLRLSV